MTIVSDHNLTGLAHRQAAADRAEHRRRADAAFRAAVAAAERCACQARLAQSAQAEADRLAARAQAQFARAAADLDAARESLRRDVTAVAARVERRCRLGTATPSDLALAELAAAALALVGTPPSPLPAELALAA